MREKRLRLVVTFHTTAAAIAMEKFCLERNVPGRLIPVPREITAGCGMAWSAPPEARGEIGRALAEQEIEAEAMIELVI